MGSGPWRFYNNARKLFGEAGFDFVNDAFSLLLFGEDSNADELTRVNLSELTDEVAEANGYTQGGQQLQNVIWDVGSSASEYRFTADPVRWDAVGGDITNIRWGVIAKSDGTLFCVAELETFPLVVTAGNPFIITPNVGGIFELS